MSWHNYDITWSKEFKDFAVYSMMWMMWNANTVQCASEWLFNLYSAHESACAAFETDYDHATTTELEAYCKQLSTLINKSKELKAVRKWFKHLEEQTGHDYMKDLRKAMREDYEVVIE